MPEPQLPVGVWFGVDPGQTRMGFAMGSSLSGSAEPLAIIDASSRERVWNELDALIAQWSPVLFVVGEPHHADFSQIHERAAHSMRWANRLHARYRVPVWLIDEHGSSLEADHKAPAHRTAKSGAAGLRHESRDHWAAAIILQRFIDDPTQARPASAMNLPARIPE